MDARAFPRGREVMAGSALAETDTIPPTFTKLDCRIAEIAESRFFANANPQPLTSTCREYTSQTRAKSVNPSDPNTVLNTSPALGF